MTLSVSHLSLQFGEKTIFQDVNFELAQGQIACLLGHSGCGKTSILRCLLGFETPKAGTITLNNTPLFNQTVHVAPHKRHIGMVFQDYALFPHLTVAQNIAFGIGTLSKSAQNERICELLTLIDMTDYQKRYPHELSGGQQQRVALARTLAPRPQLVLLDEPFSNLDVDLRTTLSTEVRALLKSENVSAVLVTHDQAEAFNVADVVGIMANGTLQQWDSPTGLYHTPKTQAVASFVGEGSLLNVITLDTHNQYATTTFGKIAYANTPTDTQKILVRPENVLLNLDNAETYATISHKSFRGNYWLYELIKDDNTLLAQGNHHQDYAIGDVVGVSVNMGWAL